MDRLKFGRIHKINKFIIVSLTKTLKSVNSMVFQRLKKLFLEIHKIYNTLRYIGFPTNFDIS